uniref:Chemosensory protein 1 n=1 Tax=Agrotis ipsilon TaxID=56364 RepID=U5KD70_AGRIP|nr:chemosensory protein 1 [Agrotis ipsilon]
MKAVIVLCALVVAVCARPEEEKYPDKYDNTNYKEILENGRLYRAYCDCLLDAGKCTPEGKELKSRIKDALETKCEKCTDKQKEAVRYVIKYLINKKPEDWKKVCDKYDPDGKLKSQYEKELKDL